MWAKLRSRKKPQSQEIPIESELRKKSVELQTAAEHHYFKGHQCSIPLHKQTKYDIEDNRKCLWNFILNLTSVRSGDIRARYMYRSYAALSAETHRHYTKFPCAIHPYSRLRLAVDTLSILVIQICLIVLNVYFLTKNPDIYTERIINVCEGIYFLTIILNFFTGYEQGRSSRFVVLELKKIACRYLISFCNQPWLITDLLFVAGFAKVFVSYGIKTDVILSALKAGTLPTLFRYTDNVLQVLGASEATKTLLRVSQFIGNYLICNMIFQFSLEYYAENTRDPSSPRSCSWLSITNMWNATFFERKVNAFNRAVGMLQQNSNLNLLEQDGCFEAFFVAAWRLGKLIEIHCALSVMLMLFGLESAKARYFMIAQQVKTYLDQRRFPDRIKKKILKFYDVRYQTNFFVEHRMMECVSGRLREDIIMHSSRQLVGEVEFLKHLPRSLLLQISVKLKVVIFLAGDIIFKINTVGDCLYFIDKGTVAIYSESGQEICHLQDGDFFGEIALVIQPRFRTASAVAVTICELFRLDKKDFESTIAIFPTVYEDIKKVAFQRLERTVVMDEHHKAELRKYQNEEEDQMSL